MLHTESLRVQLHPPDVESLMEEKHGSLLYLLPPSLSVSLSAPPPPQPLSYVTANLIFFSPIPPPSALCGCHDHQLCLNNTHVKATFHICWSQSKDFGQSDVRASSSLWAFSTHRHHSSIRGCQVMYRISSLVSYSEAITKLISPDYRNDDEAPNKSWTMLHVESFTELWVHIILLLLLIIIVMIMIIITTIIILIFTSIILDKRPFTKLQQVGRKKY